MASSNFNRLLWLRRKIWWGVFGENKWVWVSFYEFSQGLIEAETDNGITCLGVSNLGAQIKVVKKIVKQTQIVPLMLIVSSLVYCNN